MNEEPRTTVHDSTFLPNISREQIAQQRSENDQTAHSASREASEREAAHLRSLNAPPAPKLKPPSLRAPVVASDFAEQTAALDEAIYSRGVKISRERLLSLGRERFAELLAIDRTARALQRVTIADYTSWPSVEYGFACTSPLSTNMPRRRTADIASGRFAEREKASRIDGFGDLWKSAQHAPTIRNVLAFHDCFVRLIFGQSMLERLSSDNRVRSRLFCGGHGRKVELFNDWIAALDESAHVKITIEQPIFSVLAWLCREQTPCADATELARDFFGVRAPSLTHIKLAQAVFEGFLLSYRSWSLWQHVGNAARHAIEHDTLEVWRRELAKRYAAIAQFHELLREYFFRETSSHGHGHFQFDATAYHSCLERTVHKLVDCASVLAAQVIEETAQGALVARFFDSLLCEGNATTVSTKQIGEKLAAAFRGLTFIVTIDELRP